MEHLDDKQSGNQCDWIRRNLAIRVNIFSLGQLFFQEFMYNWAILGAIFFNFVGNFLNLFAIGRLKKKIWVNY